MSLYSWELEWKRDKEKVEAERGYAGRFGAGSPRIAVDADAKKLGDKRREISPPQIDEITRIYELFRESGQSRIFATVDFGYRKITVASRKRSRILHETQRVSERIGGENRGA